MTSSATVEGKKKFALAHGQTLSYPVNHFAVTVCVVESTICRCEKQKNQSGMLKQWLMMEDKAQGRRRDHFDKFGGSMSNMKSSAGYLTCASCPEDVSERLRVKYPCWTASSCYQYEMFVLTDSLIVDN